MSNPADKAAQAEGAALTQLEQAVTGLLIRLEELRERAGAAEQKSAELEELVRRFTGNPEETGRLLSKLERLEDENLELRERLHAGREGVDRVLARIRFLENQR